MNTPHTRRCYDGNTQHGEEIKGDLRVGCGPLPSKAFSAHAERMEQRSNDRCARSWARALDDLDRLRPAFRELDDALARMATDSFGDTSGAEIEIENVGYGWEIEFAVVGTESNPLR